VVTPADSRVRSRSCTWADGDWVFGVEAFGERDVERIHKLVRYLREMAMQAARLAPANWDIALVEIHWRSREAPRAVGARCLTAELQQQAQMPN
jgi:hypothetical protein